MRSSRWSAPSGDGAAQARIDAVLRNLYGRGAERYARRVRAVAAELTAPGLGLSDGERPTGSPRR